MSTIVVIAGIGLVWPAKRGTCLAEYADALAGLAVAAVILWVGRSSVDDPGCLAGTRRTRLATGNRQAVTRMDGVLDVDRVRCAAPGIATLSMRR